MHPGLWMRGFSIVELVMIIAVVAVLAITALPRFFDVSIFQDRAFYDEAIASVRYAQKLAVAARCPVFVQFSASGYSLLHPSSASLCDTATYATAVAVSDPSDPQAVYVRSAPSGLVITSTAETFSFTASGGTAANVSVVIGERSFMVNAETGFVQD